MPAVPSVAAGVDAAAADPVPAAGCEKLAEDAAQTTLMVMVVPVVKTNFNLGLS